MELKNELYFQRCKYNVQTFLVDFTDLYIVNNDCVNKIVNYLEDNEVYKLEDEINEFESDILCKLNPCRDEYSDDEYSDDEYSIDEYSINEYSIDKYSIDEYSDDEYYIKMKRSRNNTMNNNNNNNNWFNNNKWYKYDLNSLSRDDW